MSRAVTAPSADKNAETDRENSGVGFVRRTNRVLAPLIVILIAAVVYGSLYFRENSMPTGVGANLVPAERVLKGEIPYRDFYKIQTPGILLLNAWLFKLCGTSLLTALRGVLVFKLLTLAMVFIVARLVVSWKTALIPTVLAFTWLPPGGPFRPAPIQYEMLFTLVSMYFALRWVDSRKTLEVFASGLAIGIVALFKQNVGVYLALALLVIIARWSQRRGLVGEATLSSPRLPRSNRRALVAAVTGMALPLVGLLVYLVTNHALEAALRVFIRGPAEHIQMKLTGYPFPGYAAVVVIAGALAFWTADYIVGKRPAVRTAALGLLIAGAAISALVVPAAVIDNTIYWFAPALILFAVWRWLRLRRNKAYTESESTWRNREMLLTLVLYAAASYGEVFPRSVRGLVIGTLPPAFILLTFLLGRDHSNKTDEPVTETADVALLHAPQRRAVFAVVCLVLAVFALRIIVPHYLAFGSGGLKLKANTELNFDRGRGVCLPASRAVDVDSSVELIRNRVPDGGYFFAHALDATPYYFLADRNSPTGATLWNDAGTNDVERARTMQILTEKDVRLILSSSQALAAEQYRPLVDFIKNDFHESATIGKIVFLERNY